MKPIRIPDTWDARWFGAVWEELKNLLATFLNKGATDLLYAPLVHTHATLPLTGTGSPEGSVAASVGTLYIDSTGGVGSTLYVKEVGAGDTGWAAK